MNLNDIKTKFDNCEFALRQSLVIYSMRKFRLIIVVATVIVAILLLRGKIPHEKFNSNKWKTANLNLEENWTLRWDMLNDLRNRYHLVGMTKTQIVDLLGSSGDTISHEFRYYLGYLKEA
jgi:hypothetical protein